MNSDQKKTIGLIIAGIFVLVILAAIIMIMDNNGGNPIEGGKTMKTNPDPSLRCPMQDNYFHDIKLLAVKETDVAHIKCTTCGYQMPSLDAHLQFVAAMKFIKKISGFELNDSSQDRLYALGFDAIINEAKAIWAGNIKGRR